MTYAEAIQFLYELRWFGTKFGLKNTVKLAALAGNPHERLRFSRRSATARVTSKLSNRQNLREQRF